jgi:hypothetical protein
MNAIEARVQRDSCRTSASRSASRVKKEDNEKRILRVLDKAYASSDWIARAPREPANTTTGQPSLEATMLSLNPETSARKTSALLSALSNRFPPPPTREERISAAEYWSCKPTVLDAPRTRRSTQLLDALFLASQDALNALPTTDRIGGTFNGVNGNC